MNQNNSRILNSIGSADAPLARKEDSDRKLRMGNIHVRAVNTPSPEGRENSLGEIMYVCMVTHIPRVWINRVRLPILHVVS